MDKKELEQQLAMVKELKQDMEALSRLKESQDIIADSVEREKRRNEEL